MLLTGMELVGFREEENKKGKIEMADEETVQVFDKESESINIPHRESARFLSDFASGAIITGPTIENLYFLTFFSEAISVKSENGKILGPAKTSKNPDITYQILMEESDVESFREDKARITVSRETLISLRDLLNRVQL